MTKAADIINLRRLMQQIKIKKYAGAVPTEEHDLDYIQYLKDSLKSSEKKDRDARSVLEETLSSLGNISAEKVELPAAEYERKTYDAPSDDEIAQLAESKLTEYKQLSEAAINSAAEEGAKAKQDAIENERKAAEQSSKETQAKYESAVQDFENDAIKRGVARSSIAVNNSAAIRSAGAEALSAAAAELESKVASLESEISQLEASRQKALDNFNITYAAKLTETINELAMGRDKKAAEVLEYNNKLTEKETDQAYDKALAESDLYSDALNQSAKEKELETNISSSAYKAKYEAIESYLSSLPKADAKNAVLNDSIIRDNLSDYYYYKVYNDYVSAK